MRKYLKLGFVFISLWIFFSGLLFISGALFSTAQGDVFFHGLDRVVTNNGEVRDTFRSDIKPEGLLSIQGDANSGIEEIFFLARVGDKSLGDHVSVKLGSTDKITYRAESLWDSREYDIQVLYGENSVVLIYFDDGGSIVLLKYRPLTML